MFRHCNGLRPLTFLPYFPGGTLGVADGLISMRMLNPDAGIGSYAFAAGAGVFGGSLNPVGAGSGLAGGGLGYLIGGPRGYLTGSLAGGMLTGNLSHAWTVSARQAAARFGIEASVSLAGAGIQYSRGGSFDEILFGANIGRLVGGGIAAAGLRRSAVAPVTGLKLSDKARELYRGGKVREALDVHYEDLVRLRTGGTSQVINGREIACQWCHPSAAGGMSMV